MVGINWRRDIIELWALLSWNIDIAIIMNTNITHVIFISGLILQLTS